MNIDCLLVAHSGSSISSRNQLLKEMNIDIILQRPLNLAIAYLGTHLHKNGMSFAYINSIEDESVQLKQIILNNNVMCVGFSTTFCNNTDQLSEFVSLIRSMNSEIQIIIGGAYISNYLRNFSLRGDHMLQYAFRRIKADFYVDSFYGEDILSDLIETIKDGGDLKGIPNIYYREGKNYFFTHQEKNCYAIENYSINWSLFQDSLKNYVHVRTAVSCPFSCSFCVYPMNAGPHQCLSLFEFKRTMNEIKMLEGINTLSFIDDTFNMPLDRFKKILEMFIKNKYGFKWYSYIRCQYIDDEITEMMQESGCIGAILGIESGSDRMLKIMNKNACVKDYERGIKLLHKYNIQTFASFVIGFPGETSESLEETRLFIEKSKPTYYYAGVWFYDERAPITKYKEQYEISGSGEAWSHKTMNAIEAFAYSNDIRQAVQNSISCDENIDNIMQLSQSVEMPLIKEYLYRLRTVIVHELKDHDKYYKVKTKIEQS